MIKICHLKYLKKQQDLTVNFTAVPRGWREVPTPRAQFLEERKNENLAFNVKNYNGQCRIFCLPNL
jgi:hypothetical protein